MLLTISKSRSILGIENPKEGFPLHKRHVSCMARVAERSRSFQRQRNKPQVQRRGRWGHGSCRRNSDGDTSEGSCVRDPGLDGFCDVRDKGGKDEKHCDFD